MAFKIVLIKSFKMGWRDGSVVLKSRLTIKKIQDMGKMLTLYGPTKLIKQIEQVSLIYLFESDK